MSTSSSKTSIDINLDAIEVHCIHYPKLPDPTEAIITTRFNHDFDPNLPILPLCMHSENRDVKKTPTELGKYSSNKGSRFHSEGREWNKSGEISWAVLSGWCPAYNRKYGKEINMGYSRILYITAILRRHWIMAGERNKTPRGRAEAMEVIREAGLRFDGQNFDKRRIIEIASNEFIHIRKLEGARGKHMTEHKETMVRKEDRLGAFISEQQSQVNSGQAYESAYDSGRDPENYLTYDSANYPASNPPSTPTSMSANRNPSTPLKQNSVSNSLHGDHNSHKSLSKKRQPREARSTRSGKAQSTNKRAKRVQNTSQPQQYKSSSSTRI
ncbi:hypothetical protein BOTCAL_0181g00040 [Botryotinia calthae]|uniref:Uncharacterized protein n=1 Tax=Botryotinia calthae TaxID=38488 RepID=A0A4Y8D136_9HELO|nr:hypothetical protein BOTCAL_0181g00040 [Botryotinia calthae]